MRFSLALAASLAVSVVQSSPLAKRHVVSTPVVNDGIILNYALTLEYLERKFYMEGLANYTRDDFVKAGFEDPFYDNLKEIYFDEQTHVQFLSDALKAAGVTPTNELQYSFGTTNPMQFVTLSSLLEGVGVSAYLGAARDIMNKDYLDAAGAILTVEARHTAYIRASLNQVPFPNAFDTPLKYNQVFSLAADFITGGSSPVALPFKEFPELPLQCSQYYYEADRSSVTFSGAFKEAQKNFGIKKDTPIYAVFFSGLKKLPVQVRITAGNAGDYKIDRIPAGVVGQAYVLLSKSATDFSDENTIAGVSILEVYKKGMAPATPKEKCQ